MWDLPGMDLDAYLDALASDAPTPGGGSASALVAANGAALISMVARITLRSARFAPVHPQAQIFAEQADSLREQLRKAGEADEDAYGELRAALALPKSTDAEIELRMQRREQALGIAAAAPLHIAELSSRVGTLAQASLALKNSGLESDLLCAAEFSVAAANAAGANVLINHRSMKDEMLIASQRERLLRACESADRACSAVRESFVSVVSG